ncbi:tRNA-guanine transglycosylase DpdA [Polycyclovorans algicola]|uniref:tRNA-guanine transglycosylase DpdA n=1 Tax=Polycyclovorans algicola TaxID=616992 RepID=UPI0005BCB54B|nr:tRNA-guanine transglycosylase DpdA [Polycyclovorans algicola]
MKFLYSDTQDYVDPGYDFLNDRCRPGRERYWSDVYAHEFMDPAPYDGLLVSMSAVRQAAGVATSKVRYSTREEQRLLRDGARQFLRYGGPRFKDTMLLGDCGAFAYVEHPVPAYAPEEVVEFYTEAGFTHGISPDHIIFACDLTNPSEQAVDAATRQRFAITLANAEVFLGLVKREGMPFEPLGPVQGWSPKSMAEAAHRLERMGYRYLAIGGLVPLKVDAIKAVLTAIRERIRPETEIHLLGFAKADSIHEFTGFGITSFDSTSPLIRAFKDEKANYYREGSDGRLEYYTAIRIPQATENARLMQGIKRGQFSAEDLLLRERRALIEVRAYDRGASSAEATLDAVMDYHQFLLRGDGTGAAQQDKALRKTAALVQRTLKHQPWKECDCAVCRDIGVEVIIFRSSNRNKRRGMHNLSVYHRHLSKTIQGTA